MQTFSLRVRSCKVFAAEQMIIELNKLLFQTKVKEKKLKKIIPNKPILKTTNNLKNNKAKKYSFAPGKIDAKNSVNDQ